MHTISSLAILLSRLKGFASPRFDLEQYATPSQIAAEFLFMMPLEGRKLLDLGCGTGILSVGAAELGAHVIGVDVDESALAIARENSSEVEYRQQSVLDPIDGDFDIVVMNPPFGTKNKHADKEFLQVALSKAPIVLSMHKTSTMNHLIEWMQSRGFVLAKKKDVRYLLGNTMKHHTKGKQYIDVSLCLWQKDL